MSAHPPSTVGMKWCPVCGRDDRSFSLGSKYHSTGGKRCPGTPIPLVYELSLRSSRASEAALSPVPVPVDGKDTK